MDAERILNKCRKVKHYTNIFLILIIASFITFNTINCRQIKSNEQSCYKFADLRYKILYEAECITGVQIKKNLIKYTKSDYSCGGSYPTVNRQYTLEFNSEVIRTNISEEFTNFYKYKDRFFVPLIELKFKDFTDKKMINLMKSSWEKFYKIINIKIAYLKGNRYIFRIEAIMIDRSFFLEALIFAKRLNIKPIEIMDIIMEKSENEYKYVRRFHYINYISFFDINNDGREELITVVRNSSFKEYYNAYGYNSYKTYKLYVLEEFEYDKK